MMYTQCIIVAIGCAIFGAGIDAFVLPHKLVSTGISGVGLILYYITGTFRWYMECDFKHSYILGGLALARQARGHQSNLYGTVMLS